MYKTFNMKVVDLKYIASLSELEEMYGSDPAINKALSAEIDRRTDTAAWVSESTAGLFGLIRRDCRTEYDHDTENAPCGVNVYGLTIAQELGLPYEEAG